MLTRKATRSPLLMSQLLVAALLRPNRLAATEITAARALSNPPLSSLAGAPLPTMPPKLLLLPFRTTSAAFNPRRKETR
jgi:hypothetical protein